MNDKPTVIIIGGGASGMLVGVNLLRNCKSALKIVAINSGESVGVAYHPISENHLLNVMTGKMSVFPDEPDHFVRWLITDHSYSDIEIETLGKTYLPRKVYGEYLKAVWNEAIKSKQEVIDVEMINSRVIDISRNNDGQFTIKLREEKEVVANYVVLATGNAPPRNPSIRSLNFYQSLRYYHNPWKHSSVENLEADKDILIIGNGLTMVDTVLSIIERKHKGTIYSISPNGFGILQHRHNGVPYNGMVREVDNVKDLHQLVSLFNKHVKKIRRLGLSAEPLIDSLRPLTQSLWMSFTISEKKKFMTRLRHLWGVARHRLPIQVYDHIQKLKIEGKLKVMAGSIINFIEENDGVLVEFFEKKSKTSQTLRVDRVINCTGPEVDIQKMDDQLFKNLIDSGLITPDPLNIGLQADSKTLQIVDGHQKLVSRFFVLGGLLRGLLWESTAIPEIRSQAKHIADQIITCEKQK